MQIQTDKSTQDKHIHNQIGTQFPYLPSNPFAQSSSSTTMNQWIGNMGLMYNIQVCLLNIEKIKSNNAQTDAL